MKKLIKILIGSLVILSVLFAVVNFSDSSNLQINFFDVGQGDGILIRTPSHHNIIVDGGPDNTFIAKLGQALPFYDQEIDLMVLTHPHDDHLFGLVEVLKRYKVKQVLATGVIHTTAAYLEWLSIIKEKPIPFKVALAGQQFVFGETELKVIYPLQKLANQQVDNLNLTSVVIKLTYGQTDILLTGDLEKEAEAEILASKVDLKSEILKIGHHGSNTSSGEQFIKAINPSWAVISVGQDNKFDHPSAAVIEFLASQQIQVLRTDQLGDIRFISNGQDINTFYSKNPLNN